MLRFTRELRLEIWLVTEGTFKKRNVCNILF